MALGLIANPRLTRGAVGGGLGRKVHAEQVGGDVLQHGALEQRALGKALQGGVAKRGGTEGRREGLRQGRQVYRSQTARHAAGGRSATQFLRRTNTSLPPSHLYALHHRLVQRPPRRALLFAAAQKGVPQRLLRAGALRPRRGR